IKPDYALAWSSRGSAKKNKGDLPGAIKDLDKALELDAKNAFNWWNRGETYYKMGNYDKAIPDLDKAIELDPNYFFPWQVRGNRKRAKKDYTGAITDFTASLKIFNGAYTLMYRGLAYTEMGKAAEAQADFDAALKLYPAVKTDMDQELAKLKSAGAKPKA